MTCLACSGDTTDPVSAPPGQLFWAIQLNWHAVNVALSPPYNTVQLTATAFAANGSPLGSAAPLRYLSTDSTVTVDSTGLVTAHYVTGKTMVIATSTVQGETLADTAFIRVTSTSPPAPVVTFSIHPAVDGIDSARVAVDNSYSLGVTGGVIPVYATIATGDAATDTICNVNSCALLVSFTSSNPTIANINRRGAITTYVPGHVIFAASTLAYGVAKVDSLPFVVGYPIGNFYLQVNVINQTTHDSPRQSLAFSPQSYTVGVGANVIFSNVYTAPVDLVFADTVGLVLGGCGDPDNVVNAYTVAPLVSDSAGHGCAVATFNHIGTYAYHSMLAGISGTIIVSSGP